MTRYEKLDELAEQFRVWREKWDAARATGHPDVLREEGLGLVEEGKRLATEALDLAVPVLEELSPEMRTKVEFLMAELTLLKEEE